jgi:predicted nucleic acid-binding protein
VDTSVWSAALRRSRGGESPVVSELKTLIGEHRVEIIGPVRQEILSGIREESHFTRLQQHLEAFPDLALRTEDFITAASYFNLCRARGIQGSNTDFLLCSVAVRNGLAIFTTDKDFAFFAQHLPISLHQTREPQL